MQEQNGTFDMMGNVWEWNETYRRYSYILRGGTYSSNYPNAGEEFDLSSSSYDSQRAGLESDSIGFRVASVPEPVTLLIFGLGSLLLKRRKG
jgi:formylglycine-generating enzyme required for sulfatase activity